MVIRVVLLSLPRAKLEALEYAPELVKPTSASESEVMFFVFSPKFPRQSFYQLSPFPFLYLEQIYNLEAEDPFVKTVSSPDSAKTSNLALRQNFNPK